VKGRLVIADRRDHLDLQVNLLTERKATQIIQMLDRLSLHVGVEQHPDADSRELGRLGSSIWLMRWSADCRMPRAIKCPRDGNRAGPEPIR
jgi:hypothetical protein